MAIHFVLGFASAHLQHDVITEAGQLVLHVATLQLHFYPGDFREASVKGGEEFWIHQELAFLPNALVDEGFQFGSRDGFGLPEKFEGSMESFQKAEVPNITDENGAARTNPAEGTGDHFH